MDFEETWKKNSSFACLCCFQN